MLIEPFLYSDSGTIDSKGRLVYPNGMDKPMIPVCNLINKIPGIQTIFCCQGHRFYSEKTRTNVWNDGYICMLADSIDGLNFLTRVVKKVNDNITCDLRAREDWKTKLVFCQSRWHEAQCGMTRVRFSIRYKLSNAQMRSLVLVTLKNVLRKMIKEEME